MMSHLNEAMYVATSAVNIARYALEEVRIASVALEVLVGTCSGGTETTACFLYLLGGFFFVRICENVKVKLKIIVNWK